MKYRYLLFMFIIGQCLFLELSFSSKLEHVECPFLNGQKFPLLVNHAKHINDRVVEHVYHFSKSNLKKCQIEPYKDPKSGEIKWYWANKKIPIKRFRGKFVQSPDGKMYMAGINDETIFDLEKKKDVPVEGGYKKNCPGVKSLGKYFNVLKHTSFLKGKDVSMAGSVWFEDGELRGLSNNSGHYFPSRDYLMEFTRLLHQKDLFPKNKPVIIYDYTSDSENRRGINSGKIMIYNSSLKSKRDKKLDDYLLKFNSATDYLSYTSPQSEEKLQEYNRQLKILEEDLEEFKQLRNTLYHKDPKKSEADRLIKEIKKEIKETKKMKKNLKEIHEKVQFEENILKDPSDPIGLLMV